MTNPPLRKRPMDMVLMVLFSLFSLGWLLFDLPTNISRHRTKSQLAWINNVEPILLKPPLAIKVIMKIAFLVYGPCYFAIIYGLWRNRPWLRRLALLFSPAIVASTLIYMAIELTSPTPPRDFGKFFGFNTAYIIGPLALLFRCLKQKE